jgi:hypothetical protein
MTSNAATTRNVIVLVAAIVALLAGTRIRASQPPGTQIPAAEQTAPVAATCLAIVLPTVTGVGGNATDVASALREMFSSYLTGPSIQILPLEARVTSQAVEEAHQKQCDRLLTATLAKRRTGGGLLGSVLGQAGSTAAYYLPFGNGATAALARGMTAAGAQAVITVAASTKAKDEMRLDYQLTSGDGAVRFGPKSGKLKANEDGEDLVTPLVRNAADEIVGAMRRK